MRPLQHCCAIQSPLSLYRDITSGPSAAAVHAGPRASALVYLGVIVGLHAGRVTHLDNNVYLDFLTPQNPSSLLSRVTLFLWFLRFLSIATGPRSLLTSGAWGLVTQLKMLGEYVFPLKIKERSAQIHRCLPHFEQAIGATRM